jgi:hypothetical protein
MEAKKHYATAAWGPTRYQPLTKNLSKAEAAARVAFSEPGTVHVMDLNTGRILAPEEVEAALDTEEGKRELKLWEGVW